MIDVPLNEWMSGGEGSVQLPSLAARGVCTFSSRRSSCLFDLGPVDTARGHVGFPGCVSRSPDPRQCSRLGLLWSWGSWLHCPHSRIRDGWAAALNPSF